MEQAISQPLNTPKAVEEPIDCFQLRRVGMKQRRFVIFRENTPAFAGPDSSLRTLQLRGPRPAWLQWPLVLGKQARPHPVLLPHGEGNRGSRVVCERPGGIGDGRARPGSGGCQPAHTPAVGAVNHRDACSPGIHRI
jgi:hypothetical protein